MEFDTGKQRFRSTARSRRNVQTAAEYSNNVQLYTVPPTETISLQEFEELAMDRLKGSYHLQCGLTISLKSATQRSHYHWHNPTLSPPGGPLLCRIPPVVIVC